MEAGPVHHPSREDLAALVSGKLDEAAADRMVAHLEACSDCRQAAAHLSGDSFLRRLRAGRRSGSTTSGAHAAGDTPSSGARSGLAGSLAPSWTTSAGRPAAPPELRDYPDYEIVRELGRGGMGVVYLARNKLTERQEALKVVNQRRFDRADTKDRFLREIRSAVRLDHPNIVRAYTAVQRGDLMVLAMEYVEGEDLAALVKGRGPLPVVNACYYVQQAALGLQHACDKGMVHRDIKPQNLILARDGKKHTVKILDFGLAKPTREGEAQHLLTAAGQLLGTPDFIAPEQAQDAARADIRSDLYSLGCTLYFLLTGRPPFEANSCFEMLLAHHSLEATPLDQVRKDVPPELAAIVARLMAKDPAQRYQKPVEVVQVMAPFVKAGLKPMPGPAPAEGAPASLTRGHATASPAPSPRPTAGARASSRSRVGRPTGTRIARLSRQWIWPLSLAGLLFVLTGTVVLWAGGVFRVKTPEGILVVEVNEPEPDVYVDGDRLTVTWGRTARRPRSASGPERARWK
jgi:serine/threonine protein kinase